MDSILAQQCRACRYLKPLSSFSAHHFVCKECRQWRLCEMCRRKRRQHLFALDPSRADGRSGMCPYCAIPKVCAGCGEEVPGWQFTLDPNEEDGRSTRCYRCVTPKIKRCPRCQLEKTSGDFASDPEQPDGKSAVCRYCQNDMLVQSDMASAWNQQRSLALATRDRDRDSFKLIPDQVTRINQALPSSTATDIGLTKGEARALRDNLVELQDGKCAICLLPFGPKVRASLDHCHRQKRVRGALCQNCNTILGMARDNPTVLQRAAAYILEHESAPSPSR